MPDLYDAPREEAMMRGTTGMTGMTRWAARFTALALPVLLAAVLAAGAMAGGPSSQVYGNSGANVQSSIAPTTTTGPEDVQASAPAGTATLPFTGLDLGIICVAGVLLIGVGFTLRRVTRKTPPS